MLKRQKNTHKTNMHRQLRKREEAEAERGTSIAYYALRQQHFTSPSMDTRAREGEKEQNVHTQLEEEEEEEEKRQTTTTRATID